MFFFLFSVLLAVVVTHLFSLEVLKKSSGFVSIWLHREKNSVYIMDVM